MSNSLEELREIMRKGSVTLGWGAVAAYSRHRLNRLLEQQYLARLEDNNYLPPFSYTLIRAGVDEAVIVHGLEFGSPLLSFSNASISNSKAILTLNIIKGTVRNSSRLVGSFEITEALNYWLQMEVDLETVRGEVDPYGRIALNLARGATFSSNLFGNEADLNTQLVKALEAWMVEMPARCAMFELGTVDFRGYGPLTPTQFTLRTQAAAGARIRDANNYGDGAVLVFMELRGKPGKGQLPDDRYLYLVPDGDYSATLVLNQDLLGHASEDGLELLARLLFPDLNAFIKKDDVTEVDRAIFGNIDPLRTSLTVKPAKGAVVVAGKTQQFVLHDGNDQPIQARAWSVLNPQSHDNAGRGSIDDNGLYTAPSAEEMGQDLLTIIVHAEYVEKGQTYRGVARAQVISQEVLAMPAVGTYRPQHSANGVELWNAGKGSASFEMQGQQLGEIARLGNGRSRFVPHQRVGRRIMGVQQLRASTVEKDHSALVLVHNQPLVSLDPPFVPKLGFGVATQLSEVNRIMPNASRRWRMLAGPGSVSPSGQFTASGLNVPQPNVVACEVVRNGVVFAAGYSVVKETHVRALNSWTTLQRFDITVGKSPEGTRGAVTSNGFQQLEVEITVTTDQEDGKDYKLSPTEIASLTLFDRSGQKIAGLCDNEEGIGSVFGNVWRTSRAPNRFVLANEGVMRPDERAAQPAAERGLEDRTIRESLYLHRRGVSGSQVFYAGFQAANGTWFYSNSTDHRNGTIEVQVITPLPYKTADYTLVRKRVAGGGGSSGGADPEHEDFDLHLVTDDYWLLDYTKGTFYTAEFVKAKESDSDGGVNASMVRWESPYEWENFHSYTGYLFQNHGEAEPERVSFDPAIAKVFEGLNYERPVANEYEAGLLVIANFRNMNRYLGQVREMEEFKKMSKPLRVQLRDEKGNVHLLQIDYLSADTIGDRNVLVHSVPSRPSAGAGSIVRLNDKE